MRVSTVNSLSSLKLPFQTTMSTSIVNQLTSFESGMTLRGARSEFYTTRQTDREKIDIDMRRTRIAN